MPTTPEDQSEGVIEAVRLVLDARRARTPQRSERFAHGMTVATNALLEGRARAHRAVATDGFADVIELGRQDRPHLYRLCDGAACAAGAGRAALRRARADDPGRTARARAADDARALVRAGAPRPSPRRSRCACCTPTPTRDTSRRSGSRSRELRFRTACTCRSRSELVGTFREFERTATTEIDAALSPLLSRYLRALGRARGRAELPEPAIMQSSGGLTDAEAAARTQRGRFSPVRPGARRAPSLLARLAGEPRTCCALTWAAPRATCA